MALNGDFVKASLNCYSCKSGRHLLHECPYLHFVPNKKAIMLRNTYNIPQERNTSLKRKILRTNMMSISTMLADLEKF